MLLRHTLYNTNTLYIKIVKNLIFIVYENDRIIVVVRNNEHYIYYIYIQKVNFSRVGFKHVRKLSKHFHFFYESQFCTIDCMFVYS